MTVSIDKLAPQKSHIDLNDPNLPTDFGMDDYILSRLMDDVMLVEYCDLATNCGEVGEFVRRGSLLIPVNNVDKMWRKGKVILKGPNVLFTEVGEIVVFPSNMGSGVSNLEVKGYGKVKNGLFLNEQRMFGVCEVNETNHTD